MNDHFASLFHGKRLLKQELHLDEPTFQSLINQNLLTEIPGIHQHQCQRCFNRDRKYFGKLPTGHIYCRKCIKMGRVSERESLYVWVGPPHKYDQVQNPCVWDGSLTPLQKQASDELVNQIKQNGSLLIHAVCGAGKTEMLYEGISYAASHSMKLCIATPRADVVRELAPRLRRDFPNVKSAALYGGSSEVDEQAQLVIATTHQLLRYDGAFDVMIVDEVDAFPYHKDPALPKAVKRAVKDVHTLIYLTATPRNNLKLKSKLNLIPTVSIPMRFHGHPLPVPTFHYIKKIEKQILDGNLPKQIEKWISDRGERRYLLFAPTVEMAKKLSSLLNNTPFVYAEHPERESLVKQFRYNNFQALITTTILERGVTFPSIDVAVIQADHDVFDEAALVQIAGRAGRSANDPTGDVSFFAGAKTNAMVRAKQYSLVMNHKAKKWKEQEHALPDML